MNKSPDDVFTPRSASVNDAMYVDRPTHQVSLATGLRGTKHLILFGESGTGKSWLYKRVFERNSIAYETINMANASRLGSISNALKNVVDRKGESIKTGFKEKKQFGISYGVMSGQLDHTGEYTIGSKEPFERCIESLRAKAGNQSAVLVVDNLESIFSDPKMMSELGNIITLIDDDKYADYRVKILLVGVPDDVKRYFSLTANLSTVSNRINELPEVARMTRAEVVDLATRGFVEELGYSWESGGKESILSHIVWVTDRIPQQVHEYCLELSRMAEIHGGTLSDSFLDDCDLEWMRQSLTANYSVIEQRMNVRETRAGRRNQTLFSLGCVDSEDFKFSDIEELLRENFAESTTNDMTLNVAGILGELANKNTPIIRRTPKGDQYRFVNPKYRMCLRTMLRKTDAGTVEKIPLEAM